MENDSISVAQDQEVRMALVHGPNHERLLGRSLTGSQGRTENALQGQRPPEKKPKIGWMDLPNKDQLFLLALCRLSEPLSNVCLLPYIFYLFAVSLAWGYISDRYGRRQSIIFGLLVSVISNAAFGLSRSLGALFFWRTLAGLANGNVSIMRTMTAEVVEERKFQTKAFLLLPLVFNSGMVLSLALGGLLADPVENLPWAFGPNGFLNLGKNRGGVAWALAYPYALPGLMNAAMLGTALLVSWLWLKETLPGAEHKSDIGLRIGAFIVRLFRNLVDARNHAEYMPVYDDESFNTTSPSSPTSPVTSAEASSQENLAAPVLREKSTPQRDIPFRKIWTGKVLSAMIAFGLLPLHNSAFMHIFPVYLSTPHADNASPSIFLFSGGLGLRSSTIGFWLSAFGIGGILLQLFIYPRLQERIGTLGILKLSLVIFPTVYAFAPYLSLINQESFFRWLGLGIIICGQIMARTMAIPSTVILLTEASPSRSVLGTVHGAGNMVSSLARAVGPAVGGVVFGWGLKNDMVGAVWWLYLVFVALGALAWTMTFQRRGEEDDD
ncbi:unnamed protein product [Parascedosporium putredinis]|uniref:Major facilitator superfamily (MFS) profile domain-containing protein n=1 Tax=Parascedosporium putredinis TaxID=1442378 RepID=A0A9P1GWP2_9PEZI|nr:unnamed protein product [Parascedosporium putredinis]CAI7989011.1 unnamed protein product [Parascedosporium putredinis]